MASTRADVVSIVAGGWSFSEVDHAKVPGHIIAVNEAAVRLRAPVGTALSMDRLWTEHRWAALKERRLKDGFLYWTRRTAVQNVEWKHLPWVKIFDNNNDVIEMSGKTGWFNGTNSGMCAINAAFQIEPKQLFLFGFDMRTTVHGSYWHPNYEWAPKGGTAPVKYSTWARQFDIIAKQFCDIGCEVINVSSISAIRSFRRVTPKELGMSA